jgi:hypothetical protein
MSLTAKKYIISFSFYHKLHFLVKPNANLFGF